MYIYWLHMPNTLDCLDVFCYGLSISIALCVIMRCRKVQLKLGHEETHHHSMCKSICFLGSFELKVFPRACCCVISLKMGIGLWQTLFYYLNNIASFFSVFDHFFQRLTNPCCCSCCFWVSFFSNLPAAQTLSATFPILL